MPPALPPTCSSASLTPLTSAVVCGRDAPCSGSDEYIVTEEAAPPPPPPPLLELLSSSPHAATPNASAATRQPDAARERETKEPLLRSRRLGGDSTHAFVKWGRSVP